MSQDQVEWVREAFASGRAAKLRLVAGHSVHECGEAAGVTGPAWWRFENGHSITTHRAASLAAVLRTMRNGEPLAAAAGDEAAAAPAPVEDEAARRLRHEIALLVAADNFLNLSAAELVRTAPQWDSKFVSETRSAARRVLRKRIFELGGEASTEGPT